MISETDARFRERTLLNSLLVVADVVDGGGDFPIKRTADVEEGQEEEQRYYYAEEIPKLRWRGGVHPTMDGSKSTPMEWLVGMETGRQLGEFYATRLEIGLKVFKECSESTHSMTLIRKTNEVSRQVLTVKFQFVNKERNKVADWLAKSW
ncbi:hypothetical protein Gotur_020359, partial [Gossypium turneri]